jgi:uncharacterized protein YndB with AHSA1/START domain
MMSPTAPRVVVTCIVRAPRAAVFDAWLTRERMARFLCAGDTHVIEIEVDARVGGEFRIVMANEQGRYEHRGRYLEIDRPSRLRFTWASAATEGKDTEVTVTFETVDEGTRVTLVHTGLSEPQISRHEAGWTSILQKLANA